jgi:hypothetical protein
MNKDRPYIIKLDNREDYLYVLVSGKTLTPEIAKLYWDEIAEMCFTLQKSKIMIEKDFAKSVSPPEMLEIGVCLGKILSGKKIAFLDQYKNESINELGKVIARNQGVVMRIFKNTDDAEKWLIGS